MKVVQNSEGPGMGMNVLQNSQTFRDRYSKVVLAPCVLWPRQTFIKLVSGTGMKVIHTSEFPGTGVDVVHNLQKFRVRLLHGYIYIYLPQADEKTTKQTGNTKVQCIMHAVYCDWYTAHTDTLN